MPLLGGPDRLVPQAAGGAGSRLLDAYITSVGCAGGGGRGDVDVECFAPVVNGAVGSGDDADRAGGGGVSCAVAAGGLLVRVNCALRLPYYIPS